MGNQGWIVFLFLGISALSWVFGKIKEKAEAEEAQKRALLHKQRKQSQSGESAPISPNQGEQIPLEKLATQRKHQLAQLRQERLATLRAEMAARLQAPKQTQRATPTRQRTAPRTTARQAPAPVQQPQQTRMNVATMRKPPSVSHDRAKLANLGTHTQHADHKATDSKTHRLVTDAGTTSVDLGSGRSSLLGIMTAKDWRKAIILSEVLAPPVSLRGGS